MDLLQNSSILGGDPGENMSIQGEGTYPGTYQLKDDDQFLVNTYI